MVAVAKRMFRKFEIETKKGDSTAMITASRIKTPSDSMRNDSRLTKDRRGVVTVSSMTVQAKSGGRHRAARQTEGTGIT